MPLETIMTVRVKMDKETEKASKAIKELKSIYITERKGISMLGDKKIINAIKRIEKVFSAKVINIKTKIINKKKENK